MLYRIEIVTGFNTETWPHELVIGALNEPVIYMTTTNENGANGRSTWRDVFADTEIGDVIAEIGRDSECVRKHSGNEQHKIRQITLIPVG